MNLLSLNQHLVRDKIRSERAADAYESRRKEVEAALLKAYREIGLVQAAVTIPGLGKVANVTLKQASAVVVADEDALLATVETNQPTEVEEIVDPKILDDPDLLEWLRKNRPDAITRRVRPNWRTALLREAQSNGGNITLETGEKIKIAEVTPREPTGAFQLTLTTAGEEMAADLPDTPDTDIAPDTGAGEGAAPEPKPAPAKASRAQRRERAS